MRGDTTEQSENQPEFNGRLTFYHANSRGTGSAIQLELKLNRNRGDNYNCFFLEMARQKTSGSTGNGRTQATFDWASKAIVKLDFLDVCEFLNVLEGRVEHVGGRHNGIYHEVDGMNTIIGFKHDQEQAGYSLGISRKNTQREHLFKGHITLTDAEATGLRSVFHTGLFFMAFHTNIRR